MWAWLAACAGPPDAWEGIDQAVVLDGGHVVVDRSSSRRQPDQTVLRVTNRCRWRGTEEVRCTLGPAGRSVLFRLGDHVLDEQIGADGARVVSEVDPETLRSTRPMALGLEPEGRVPGGSMFADGDGFVWFVNHGMSGVDVGEGDGRATFTVERWDAGALTWRRPLPRYAQEAHHVPGTVAVLADGAWTLYDAATGASRPTPVRGLPGACLDPTSLRYLADAELPALVTVPLDGTEPTIGPGRALPGWVGACVSRDGAPWFHGGDAEGDGWLLAPDGHVDRLPRVDLELAEHVDADGRLWVVELGRGWAIWDPAARAVARSPAEFHETVRVGPYLLAYSVGTNLAMTLTTAHGSATLPHRVSPRPWHVDGGHLWTFAHRRAEGEPWVQRLSLPELTPEP